MNWRPPYEPSATKADRMSVVAKQREQAVRLHREGEMTMAAIAERLGKTEKTIKNWCREARRSGMKP